jgi:NADH-quinone oxidoreductase subunit C
VSSESEKPGGTPEQKKPGPAAAKPGSPKPTPAPKLEDKLREPVPSPALDELKRKFGDAVEEVTYWAGEVTVRVPSDRILEICRFLKDDPETQMDLLSDLCAADYPKEPKRFEVLYHMYSIPRGQRLRVKTRVGEGEAVASVASVWATANWHEREAYDLFGISFEGHPDLRRILLPDDWKGHPLRKEYPLEGLPEQHPRFR